jgi:hypothetical protein
VLYIVFDISIETSCPVSSLFKLKPGNLEFDLEVFLAQLQDCLRPMMLNLVRRTTQRIHERSRVLGFKHDKIYIGEVGEAFVSHRGGRLHR